MSKLYRRFEILLPLRFNDGTPVPDDLFVETHLELRSRFGAISVETQTIAGMWQYEEQMVRDELVRVFLDVPDTPENETFFLEFKQRLKLRFKQIEIWMTSHPIRVL